ncbi:type II secretion system protein [Candidatus Saccharibacteria bacterium]|nr:type II secretion system protein [Candidatus Saccharibacteria bacterium]
MNIKSKKGFTIIEVVLVLAIAGLIFLMVFIALPNMQRSQRDTQRRNDYSALSANMTQYLTNNNGKLPNLGNLDPSKYINSTGEDPEGYYYALQVKECTSSACPTETEVGASVAAEAYGSVTTTTDSHYVFIVKNASCDGGSPVYNTSKRAFAIYGYLETGNGTYCQSNS